MNFIKRFTSSFTTRGRTLAQVEKGMALANKNQSDKAIDIYSAVIASSETPRDVLAMAMFNRALAYTATNKPEEATLDLKAILAMPESFPKIKRSASDKLVRMQRKIKRESRASSSESLPSHDSLSGGDV
ncbi:tetratricopeptide repeat protein [Mariniblastus fucicola]|uniref:Tetratricopeptide repeat protein n=1 Tax=Mariniblastus fucicola TaxID=980251 RepID=A0A5B9P8X1_9BACT|nr:hypothetical protein [Mariniblastus fucicola]QEG21076.1 hypothetical protein MFFC18_09280 [Mariniblastus fucicola]